MLDWKLTWTNWFFIHTSKKQIYFLEMHVSNLDEMRHTFYFGPNGFGPYEIDPRIILYYKIWKIYYSSQMYDSNLF